MDRHFAIQRQMERQIIREEIIEAEIIRRRRLVEEVRRELMLERHVALQGELESIHPSSMLLSNHRSPDFQPETVPLEKILEGSESKPFQRSSKPLILEVKPGSVVSEKKPITMGKPILHLSGLKRKVDTPLEIVSTDRPQPIPASSKKTRSSKSVWSCSHCQVSASSEADLKEHLNGRKHKFKELKLKQNNKPNKQDPLEEVEVETLIEIKTDCLTSAVEKKVGNKQDPLEEGEVETFLEIKTDCLPKKEEDSAVEKKVGNKQDPLEEGEVETLLEIKTNCLLKKEDFSVKKKGEPILHPSGLKRKADTPLVIVSTNGPQPIPDSSKKTRSSKSVWSCSLCHVSASSEAVLKKHLNGRKHKFKELKLKQYNKQNKQDPLEEGEAETLLEIKTDCLISAVEKKVGNKQDPLEEGEVETLLKIKTDCLPKKEEDSAVEKKVGNKQNPLKEGEIETLLEIKTVCLPKKEEKDSAVEKRVRNNEVGEMKVEMKEKENDGELKTMNTKKSNQLKHWCEICKVGTPDIKLMRAHKMGKKHWENVKLFGGRVIPTVIRTNSYK